MNQNGLAEELADMLIIESDMRNSITNIKHLEEIQNEDKKIIAQLQKDTAREKETIRELQKNIAQEKERIMSKKQTKEKLQKEKKNTEDDALSLLIQFEINRIKTEIFNKKLAEVEIDPDHHSTT